MRFLGFLAIPRQGLVSRSSSPHPSTRNIIARSISRARLVAPGLSLLAASNHAATSSGPMRSDAKRSGGPLGSTASWSGYHGP